MSPREAFKVWIRIIGMISFVITFFIAIGQIPAAIIFLGRNPNNLAIIRTIVNPMILLLFSIYLLVGNMEWLAKLAIKDEEK